MRCQCEPDIKRYKWNDTVKQTQGNSNRKTQCFTREGWNDKVCRPFASAASELATVTTFSPSGATRAPPGSNMAEKEDLLVGVWLTSRERSVWLICTPPGNRTLRSCPCMCKCKCMPYVDDGEFPLEAPTTVLDTHAQVYAHTLTYTHAQKCARTRIHTAAPKTAPTCSCSYCLAHMKVKMHLCQHLMHTGPLLLVLKLRRLDALELVFKNCEQPLV